MHHLLHHHVITHVLLPLAIATAVSMAIASQDSRGTHPTALPKIHAPTRKGN